MVAMRDAEQTHPAACPYCTAIKRRDQIWEVCEAHARLHAGEGLAKMLEAINGK